MKQIYLGEVYEILPISNGIVFSYCKEKTDGNVIVAYKMLSFENGHFTDIAKNVYLLTKFGNNYKSVVALCDNYITVKSILLPNAKVFLLSTDGTAQLVDTDASPIWKGSLLYKNNAPTDIVLYKNSLWASYAESNVLLRYNLNTLREELRVGGKKSPFNKPKNIFVENDNAYISNQGSQTITQLNLNNYSVFEYERFSQPIYQFLRVGDYRFVLLESGVYLL